MHNLTIIALLCRLGRGTKPNIDQDTGFVGFLKFNPTYVSLCCHYFALMASQGNVFPLP